MPTTENPLLRFYPQASKEDPEVQDEDEGDRLEEEESYFDGNKRVGKHNTRSSPMSDRWMKDGMNASSRYFKTLHLCVYRVQQRFGSSLLKTCS